MPHIAGPNHTQIPNIILESMDTIGNAELRVVLAVCRKTFGWQKRQDRLSLTQLQSLTGLSRQGTIDGIEDAIRNEWIVREPYGQSFVYAVNLVDQSASQSSRPEVVKPVDQLDEKLVKPVDTQKKGIKENKETNGARQPRAPRALTPLQEEQRKLETLFSELSGRPIPPGKAAVIWHITTAAWIKAANGQSEQVMRAAYAAHTHDGLSVKGPQSIDYKFFELLNPAPKHEMREL